MPFPFRSHDFCASRKKYGFASAWDEMGVSENSGFPPQIIQFNRVFHYFHHPFWGTPIFQKGTLGALGFCIFCFFMFFPFFHFHLSICPKSQGKPKRNKKHNPVRRIWSKSIPDCFFCFFGFHCFSRGFLVSQAPTVQKLEENQKKQKNQSCEKNLG